MTHQRSFFDDEFNRDREIKKRGGEGILRPDDISELNAAGRRVHELMRDGRWYSADEIRLAAGRGGQPATEGLRRMRELRARGYLIERRRVSGSRVWQYRLKKL